MISRPQSKAVSQPDAKRDPLERDRLLVVGAGREDRALVDALSGFYPDWSVSTCKTYLSGIAEIARRPARAIVAWVDAPKIRLDNAIAGLREAAEPQTRLILCCSPEYEPTARSAVSGGADDYVLYPLEIAEMDAALGYARPPLGEPRNVLTDSAAFTDELLGIRTVLSHVGARPMVLVEKLAALVRAALPTKGVTIIVEGAVATSGDVVTKPVLTAPIEVGDRVLGQLTVGEPIERPYSPGDVEKLLRYADLAAGLLEVASTQRRWRELAMTDECTGLPNRRYFHQRLADLLGEAAIDRSPLTVLLFDVDDFKQYNDTYGHDAGDEVLRLTGELFTQLCREQDVVTRYGGDEFAVIFWDPDGPRVPGSQHPECALMVLERFQEALRTKRFPKLGPSGEGSLTISGGLATYPWDGTTPNELLKRADDALLAAKRAGKNRIILIGEEHPQA